MHLLVPVKGICFFIACLRAQHNWVTMRKRFTNSPIYKQIRSATCRTHKNEKAFLESGQNKCPEKQNESELIIHED